MRKNFRNRVQSLKDCANRFDPVCNETKIQCLHELSAIPLPLNKDLITYYETLLFLIAYPSDALQIALVEKELKRMTGVLKEKGKKQSKLLENSGMPFTHTVTRFSHDAVRWLLHQPKVTVTLDSFENPTLQLNDVLSLTLTLLEKSETTAGLSNTDLMDILMVPKQQRLHFLINELNKLDHLPYIKDHLFDRLELFVRVVPKDRSFSKAYNRLSHVTNYYHLELLKKFEVRDILNIPLPAAAKLTDTYKKSVIRILKNAMAITGRETDPTTFMDESSMRLYHLERGISIAMYGIVPSRQLPLESYVGYTTFKNGFPVAYGGAWVFGERANFGLNIFESFRNGESGYIMAQLLRVYKHVFHLHYFEVEPFQFGLDNPEGIESGAFWFYYRFGFRPLNFHLRQLARKEHEKLQTKKGHRTGYKMLVQFTESSIVLKLGKSIPPKVADVTSKVTRMIQRVYKANRQLAEEDCGKKFLVKAGIRRKLTEAEHQVLNEVALWAEALKINERKKLNVMAEMIKRKPRDVYAYQKLIIKFFSE